MKNRFLRILTSLALLMVIALPTSIAHGSCLDNPFSKAPRAMNTNTVTPACTGGGPGGGGGGGGRPGGGSSYRVFNVTKATSTMWKSFKPYRGSIKYNGKSGTKRRYYEWDHTHNDIEVYDSKGIHKGSMNPTTGSMYKGPVKGRNIKNQL
jgi:Cytotoxic